MDYNGTNGYILNPIAKQPKEWYNKKGEGNAKRKIKIELNEKEYAIIYYEKTLGKNITIRKRASVLYYASEGSESITEIQKKCGYTRGFITDTLAGYVQKGINYIYDCSRGIKRSALDSIKSFPIRRTIDFYMEMPILSHLYAIVRILSKFIWQRSLKFINKTMCLSASCL